MSTKLPLNAEQERAADGFFNFLFGDKTELCISGPGGTGKTFLMGYLIDEVMPRYQESCQLLGINPVYHDVTMTATTNKAAEVLGLATGRSTSTIHSFLNLRVVDDFKTGVSKLQKTRGWTVHQGVILFVDESSMIDHQLREFIREGTHRCKIVYVGDHCQLAPVTETLSPIYKDSLPFFELTQPMRTDIPELQAINEQLRNTVKTGEFKPIRAAPGIIDWIGGADMEREINAHFADPSNRDRILAYTNSRVVQYNDHIRAMKGLPALLTKGEHVISNSAMQINRNMMHVEDEFRVDRVQEGTHHVEIDNGVDLEVQYCDLVGRHTMFSQVPIPADRNHFNQLVKYYAKKQNWQKYYQLKNNYPDLRPRDAATVHKAQGSTYDTVFIDLEDLSTCRDPSMAARLFYVAFSRAKKRVVMYGQLAKKFGGVVS